MIPIRDHWVNVRAGIIHQKRTGYWLAKVYVSANGLFDLRPLFPEDNQTLKQGIGASK
jgi:hypothetical protein